jgi:hypothetical protein
MSINRILVTKILSGYSSDLIAKMFWYQGIAKVSTVILYPDSLYQKADITIAAWCDTEAAYEFIKKLKSQDEMKHGDWIVQDGRNCEGETSSFSSAFYEALCEPTQSRWSDSWSDDEQEETMEEAIDREMRAEVLEAGEILEDEEKPVIRVYQGCEKYTIPEAKHALEVLYHYLECGYCGMTPAQIAETIESVEAQLSLYGVETKTVRAPIAPALQEEEEEEEEDVYRQRVIPNYIGHDFMTVSEAIARIELLSGLIMESNFGKSTEPSFQEMGDVFEYCDEIDYIESILPKFTNLKHDDVWTIACRAPAMTCVKADLYPIDTIAKLQQVEF